MKQWFALYTKVNEEVWAQNNLRERGLNTYLPRYAKQRNHARRIDFIKAPLFPRYLFAQADITSGERPAMAYAQGVSYIVSFGNQLAVVQENLIEELRAREGADGLVSMDNHPTFKPGQKVRVRNGALLDNTGVFENLCDDQRAFILLDLLGGKIRTRLPIAAIVDDT